MRFFAKLYDLKGKELRSRTTNSVNRFSYFLQGIDFLKQYIYLRVNYKDGAHNDGVYKNKLNLMKAWKAFLEDK